MLALSKLLILFFIILGFVISQQHINRESLIFLDSGCKKIGEACTDGNNCCSFTCLESKECA